MKLVEIQVLRALAALSVAVLHGGHEARQYGVATGTTFGPVGWLAWEAGVDVFFVISGFVMVVASRGSFGGAGAARIFLSRRVARIVPLYWLTTTFYLALALAIPAVLNSARPDPVFVAASYLFIPVARPDGLVQPLYSLGWTLNYEMAFYVLFAAAIAWPRKAAVPSLILGLAFFAGAGRLVAFPQPLAAWTDPIILEFAFGLSLGLARTEGIALGRAPRCVLAAAGLASLCLLDAEPAAAWRPLVYGIPAACLVAACGLGRDDPRREESVPARVGAAFGDASYALYLLHPFVLRAVREGMMRTGMHLPPWAILAIGLPVTLAASLLVFRFVERPLTSLVRRGLEPERAAQVRSG